MTGPAVASWGAGVDSTAMIIELESRGEPPDLVLFADTGAEYPETYAYIPIFRQWLDDRHIPFEIVRYTPTRLNGKPAYATLLEDLLASKTLPAIAFGQHSCSLKWKIAPQTRALEQWEPAKNAWAHGETVTRLIGYDASPRDIRRYGQSLRHNDPRFSNRFPLIEWQWDRAACENRIRKAGLPPFRKSSCFFCTACKADDVNSLPRDHLKLIVLLEAAAAPRLTTTEGLWRKSTKGRRGPPRPGRITDFISDTALLSPDDAADVAQRLLPALERQIDPATRTYADMATWLNTHFPNLQGSHRCQSAKPTTLA